MQINLVDPCNESKKENESMEHTLNPSPIVDGSNNGYVGNVGVDPLLLQLILPLSSEPVDVTESNAHLHHGHDHEEDKKEIQQRSSPIINEEDDISHNVLLLTSSSITSDCYCCIITNCYW
jgi:hypothetical protein